MTTDEINSYAALVFEQLQSLPLFTPITIKGLLEEQDITITEDHIFEFMKTLDSMIDFDKTNSYHLFNGNKVKPEVYDQQTYIYSSNAATHFRLGHIVDSSLTLVIELPIIRSDEILLRFYKKDVLTKGQIFPLSFEQWRRLSFHLTQITRPIKPTSRIKEVNHFFLPEKMPSYSDFWILDTISHRIGYDNVVLSDVDHNLREPFIAALRDVHPTLAKYCPE